MTLVRLYISYIPSVCYFHRHAAAFATPHALRVVVCAWPCPLPCGLHRLRSVLRVAGNLAASCDPRATPSGARARWPSRHPPVPGGLAPPLAVGAEQPCCAMLASNLESTTDRGPAPCAVALGSGRRNDGLRTSTGRRDVDRRREPPPHAGLAADRRLR